MMVRDRVETNGGLTLLDGVALVTGAAVGSVHIREAVPPGPARGAWVLIWLTFAGVSLTAAGPFVFLVRRFDGGPTDHPRMGDWLWLLLGLPWLLTGMIRASEPRTAPHGGTDPLYAIGLMVGLAVASFIALAVVWRKWVLVPPDQIRRRAPGPWTDTVGLVLSVAWPLQLGFGLVVTA